MSNVQLSEKNLLVFAAVQKQIQEFGGSSRKSTQIPLILIANAIKSTVEDVLASIVALEAAHKIRRYGRPETITVPNEQGVLTTEICLNLGLLQTPAERARAFRANQKALGRRSILLWLTPEEEQEVKWQVQTLRENSSKARSENDAEASEHLEGSNN